MSRGSPALRAAEPEQGIGSSSTESDPMRSDSFRSLPRADSFGPRSPIDETSGTGNDEDGQQQIIYYHDPSSVVEANERTPLVNGSLRRHSKLYADKVPVVTAHGTIEEPIDEEEVEEDFEDDGHGGLGGIHGQSTFGQTVFNSINILLGIGVLSLPFALKLSSLVVGVVLLLLFCVLTRYTATALSRVIELNPAEVVTYSDIGQLALGANGRIFISYFFLTELFTASVALVILASDSIAALKPEWDQYAIKLGLFLLITPTTFPKSLSFLSYVSILGIISSLNLIAITIYLGVSTPHQPGSLLEPSDTVAYLPTSSVLFSTPLTFGLIMAGFAGHAVFPNLYMDMEDRSRFGTVVNITYGFLVFLYGGIAVCGYLMFGADTKQEITLNLGHVKSYPPALTKATILLVAVNPLTKFALTSNPIALSIERNFPKSLTSSARDVLRLLSRTTVSAAIFGTAAVFPAFERAMGVLGSFFSFTVSAVFPCACILILRKDLRVGAFEAAWCGVLVAMCATMGLMGTVWAIMGVAE